MKNSLKHLVDFTFVAIAAVLAHLIASLLHNISGETLLYYLFRMASWMIATIDIAMLLLHVLKMSSNLVEGTDDPSSPISITKIRSSKHLSNSLKYRKFIKQDSGNSPTSRHSFSSRVLHAFKWFCGAKTREEIKDVIADLARDRRAMKKEGRSQWFISIVLLWQAVRSIAGVLWGGALSVLKDFVPILKAFRHPKS